MKDLEIKINELTLLKKTFNTNLEQNNFYMNNYNELLKKTQSLENEKNYLMSLIDEKNKEIENLIALEIENAELKAKNLLENLDNNNNIQSSTGIKINKTNSLSNISGGINNIHDTRSGESIAEKIRIGSDL